VGCRLASRRECSGTIQATPRPRVRACGRWPVSVAPTRSGGPSGAWNVGLPLTHPDIKNADWIRSRLWDLPTDPDAFLALLAGRGASPEQQRAALADFLRLPAAAGPMPAELRAELAARGLLAR
jgi:hypothetical protein